MLSLQERQGSRGTKKARPSCDSFMHRNIISPEANSIAQFDRELETEGAFTALPQHHDGALYDCHHHPWRARRPLGKNVCPSDAGLLHISGRVFLRFNVYAWAECRFLQGNASRSIRTYDG
jgi:hypothetical protein